MTNAGGDRRFNPARRAQRRANGQIAYTPELAAMLIYTASRFDRSDQRRLQQLVVSLSTRGCHVLLSNSATGETTALYATNADARAAGLRSLKVPARRAVNCNPARRGPVEEYVITNIKM